jgi:hypothetical protein
MAEITRETLELAALAVGHEVACTEAAFHGTDDPVKLYGGGLFIAGVEDPWRPHLDDGDAMRLAVRLNLRVEARMRCVLVHGDLCPDHLEIHDGTEPDKLRAWREAVVLCAAAVGERMRGER